MEWEKLLAARGKKAPIGPDPAVRPRDPTPGVSDCVRVEAGCMNFVNWASSVL